MVKTMRIYFFVLLQFIPVSLLFSQEERNVLFIGNSQTFVNDLPMLVKEMATSTGDILNYGESTFGGFSFLQHLNSEDTQSKIRQGNWDYVVLQGRSGWPALSDEFVEANVYPYAKQLNDSITKYNPCAEPVFYHTWGYRNGYTFYCPEMPTVCTYEGMDDMLQLRYPIMAIENDAILAPVGPVWRDLMSTFPVINLFDPDGSHPSLQGSYAGALTFYSILFRKDPNEVTYNPGIFTVEESLVKTAVTKVVYNNLEQWFVGDYDPYADFDYNLNYGLNFSFTNNSPYADSYHWDFGDGNESNSSDPDHTYVDNGSYDVVLTVSYCGNDYTKTVSIDTNILGVNDSNDFDFNLIANPASNAILVKSSFEGEFIKFNLIDLNGKLVKSKSVFNSDQTTIDVTDLNNGIYFLRINSTGKHYKTIKVLINNN